MIKVIIQEEIPNSSCTTRKYSDLHKWKDNVFLLLNTTHRICMYSSPTGFLE